MPTYQYQCRDCGHGFDQYQKFSDDPLAECPACGGIIRRVIQNVGVVFKGSGWYINDSRKSPKGETSDSPAAAAKADSGTAAAKSEKTAAKSNDSAAGSESKSSAAKAPAATTN